MKISNYSDVIDDFDYQFENFFPMVQTLIIDERAIGSTDKQLLEDIFLHLMFARNSEVEIHIEYRYWKPRTRTWESKIVKTVVFLADCAVRCFEYLDYYPDTKEPRFVFFGIHPIHVKENNFDMTDFIGGFMHEAGHILYFLKYETCRRFPEKEKEYIHHCDKDQEKFSDLVSLFALGSLKRFKRNILHEHAELAVERPDMKTEWIAEGKYRANKFDEAVQKYPEKFRALGLAC